MRTKDAGRKTYRLSKKVKAVVGIESAIVLIAFVVVAAALAFVVLNMGFFTTQRSKETIGSGLAQASSSLELDGTVISRVNISSKKVDCLIIPIRLSAGQKPVDLTPSKTNIAFWVLGEYGYANIYDKETQAVKTETNFSVDNLCTTVKSGLSGDSINVSIIWQTGNNGDNVLDPGEKALVVIAFSGNNELDAYKVFKVEIRVPIGAALTVERAIPASLTQPVIDLG
ncbi:flagellin [Desulfurococcaceae archaeon AG1]|jgi:flagellin FlaB|nr:flagellin [Desulfurococcaceae archaeon AG1]